MFVALYTILPKNRQPRVEIACQFSFSAPFGVSFGVTCVKLYHQQETRTPESRIGKQFSGIFYFDYLSRDFIVGISIIQKFQIFVNLYI